jgi:chromosome segregation ATPase
MTTKKKLEQQLGLLAYEKGMKDKLYRNLTERLSELRHEIALTQDTLNSVEKDCERIDEEGMELTRRLVEIEEAEAKT